MNINSILTSFWSSIKAYLGNNYLGKTAKAESAKSADSVAWDNVSGKPSTYTPSSHNHDDRYYTETEIDTKLNSKVNTSDLSTVATSGSYNDLSNKPTIPTVNNATLTIQKNGTTVKTFTANSNSDVTCNITVPTKISDLTNDGGFVSDLSSYYSKSETDTLLSGKSNTDHTHSNYLTGITKAMITTALGYTPPTTDTTYNVATTSANGLMSSADKTKLDGLSNYTLPTASSELGGVKTTSTVTSTSGLTACPIISGVPYYKDTNTAYSAMSAAEATTGTATSARSISAKVLHDKISAMLPTKVSQLTNDSGFLTTHQDISGKANKATTLSGYGITDAYTKSQVDNKIPTVNNATLTIQKNGTTVKTFTANANSDVICNIEVPTKVSQLTNDIGFLTASSIAFHNSYPRCKYLGTSITDAQNTAIKNRTYDDLFIGDYWTISGVNWRIVAIDPYYNVGDTNFDKGNIIVMPDTVLYNAQMNSTNTTAGAYYGSLMRTQNLNNARTIARNAFGSHLANHRILLANSVDGSGPNNWAWYDSDGVELPNEVQIYGTRVWGSALKGFDVGTQKQQFPLMAIAPQFVNIRQAYWLQDVSSYSVSSTFAFVSDIGLADAYGASYSFGVRPSVTLSYI